MALPFEGNSRDYVAYRHYRPGRDKCTFLQMPYDPGNLIPLDRGKGLPSFVEMVDFALVEVDFDDPTTNVRGRRALAIAKPTPRGY